MFFLHGFSLSSSEKLAQCFPCSQVSLLGVRLSFLLWLSSTIYHLWICPLVMSLLNAIHYWVTKALLLQLGWGYITVTVITWLSLSIAAFLGIRFVMRGVLLFQEAWKSVESLKDFGKYDVIHCSELFHQWWYNNNHNALFVDMSIAFGHFLMPYLIE